jgi:sporulation protein YlmC with PRC-barrel domain
VPAADHPNGTTPPAEEAAKVARMRLELGLAVRCAGTRVGELADVVIDPVARRVTHVVVETEDRLPRLVRIDVVANGSEERKDVELTCSRDELLALDPIRELAYLRVDEFPTPDETTDVGVEDMVTMPSYELAEYGGYANEFDGNVSLVYDRIPKGEAEVRRSSDVISCDGERLGHVAGFIVSDGQITDVVLERGHLWGTRDVTIPIASVETIATDVVSVTLTKDEVGKLPSKRAHKFL